MNKTYTAKKGFTIVELLIVIVVIAVLASISVVAYSGIQSRARDTQLREGMNQFEKSLKMYAQDYGNIIRGGYGSTTPVSSGKCSDGSSGFIGSGNYTCTVMDALVASGYLSKDFTKNLPVNRYFNAGTNQGGLTSLMMYDCATPGMYLILSTLYSPTGDETANLNTLITNSTCGASAQQRDNWGMRTARIIQL